MNRREFITTTGVAATFLLAQSVLAEEKSSDQHAGHDANTGHNPNAERNFVLMQATSHCLVVGQMCVQHCMMFLASGDVSLADCAKSVHDMGAVCTALQQLASANSPFLPAMAKLAADVCDACEKECRKHEARHMPCRACADACKTLSAECRKLAA